MCLVHILPPSPRLRLRCEHCVQRYMRTAKEFGRMYLRRRTVYYICTELCMYTLKRGTCELRTNSVACTCCLCVRSECSASRRLRLRRWRCMQRTIAIIMNSYQCIIIAITINSYQCIVIAIIMNSYQCIIIAMINNSY